MAKLFGTDGPRGIAVTDLTCELAMQTGRAAALVLALCITTSPKCLLA